MVLGQTSGLPPDSAWSSNQPIKNSNNVLERPYQITQEAKYWGLQDVATNAN